MSIREKHIIRYYTIVEVMVAMGIFLIMMTIMMQFFTSAQQMWNLSSKRNNTYADARVAMNLMTREIQCMLYRNEATDDTGIYPFWYEWTETNINVTIPANIETYFENTNEFPEKSDGSAYLTALNFIANTDIKSVEKGSDVCEIRYRFIPVYFNGGTAISNVEGGTLQRSCTAEYYDNGGTDTLTPSGATDDYNFATNPYDTAGRITTIWQDNTTVPNPGPFRTVISGVYSLRFTCYRWTGTGLAMLAVMNDAGNDYDGNPIAGYNLTTGTPAPVAVRIDMKLLAPEDLKKLAVAINESNTRQINALKQKMRTFSKVIYLGKRED